MVTSFFSEEELNDLGLKSFGKNVLISRKCSIYSPAKLSIGDNVRIDDFCILSGEISLGSNIHISAYCALYGAYGIELRDYSGMSPRSMIFSAVDDFHGEYLIGPIHNPKYTNVLGGKVLIDKFCQLGANTIVLPGVVFGEGAVTGAMSFVNKDLESWTINTGIPINKSTPRNKGVKELIKSMITKG